MMAERGELAPARQIAAKAEADGFPPALSLRGLPLSTSALSKEVAWICGQGQGGPKIHKYLGRP